MGRSRTPSPRRRDRSRDRDRERERDRDRRRRRSRERRRRYYNPKSASNLVEYEYEIILGPSNGTEQNRGTGKGIANAIETGIGARTVDQDQERGRERGLNPKRNPPQRSVL